MAADVVDRSLPGQQRCRHDNSHHRHHHRGHATDEDQLREFAQTTSLHGVPRVISAQTLVARVFWSSVCLGAFLVWSMCGQWVARVWSVYGQWVVS